MVDNEEFIIMYFEEQPFKQTNEVAFIICLSARSGANLTPFFLDGAEFDT